MVPLRKPRLRVGSFPLQASSGCAFTSGVFFFRYRKQKHSMLPPERLRLNLQNLDQTRLATDQRLKRGSIYKANAKRRRGERGPHPHNAFFSV